MGIKVKPLDWRDVEQGRCEFEAQAFGFDYEIGCDAGGWYWYENHTEDEADGFKSAGDAKASAQADYERRILSAIEVTDD